MKKPSASKFLTHKRSLSIALLAVVIIAIVGAGGGFWYRDHQRKQAAKTEAAQRVRTQQNLANLKTQFAQQLTDYDAKHKLTADSKPEEAYYYHYSRAVLLSNSGQYQQAEAEFKQAAATGQTLPLSFYANRAKNYQQLGDKVNAIATYRLLLSVIAQDKTDDQTAKDTYRQIAQTALTQLGAK